MKIFSCTPLHWHCALEVEFKLLLTITSNENDIKLAKFFFSLCHLMRHRKRSPVLIPRLGRIQYQSFDSSPRPHKISNHASHFNAEGRENVQDILSLFI